MFRKIKTNKKILYSIVLGLIVITFAFLATYTLRIQKLKLQKTKIVVPKSVYVPEPEEKPQPGRKIKAKNIKWAKINYVVYTKNDIGVPISTSPYNYTDFLYRALKYYPESWRSGYEEYGDIEWLGYGNVIKVVEVSTEVAKVEYFDKENKKKYGYVHLDYLHPEPKYTQIKSRFITTQKTPVYILPDETTRMVLTLFQGEPIDAIGEVKIGNIDWLKVKFTAGIGDWWYSEGALRIPPDRFGWIKKSNLILWDKSTIDESRLSIEEVPDQVRYSEKKWRLDERDRLTQNGFYAETVALPEDYKGPELDDMVDLYSHPWTFSASDFFLQRPTTTFHYHRPLSPCLVFDI